MIRVKVQRIESIRDPAGNMGKRIELVEENVVPSFAIRPPSEEARIVQNVFKAMQQQMPMFGVRTHLNAPKLILFLTEAECEELEVKFDVNQVYEVELSNKTMKFKRVS